MLEFKEEMLEILFDEWIEDDQTWYKVLIDGVVYFFPCSQCEVSYLSNDIGQSGSVMVPRWLVEDLELEGYVEE